MSVLNRAEEIKPFLLPIDFEESKAALETNIKTRAEAKTLLEKLQAANISAVEIGITTDQGEHLLTLT